MNMMVRDRNTIFVGLTLEFRIKNSINKNINMSTNFSITGTMSSTVRRSISVSFNINNSIIIKNKNFQTCININTDMNVNDFRGIHLGIRVSLVFV